jgi:predicted flap endonuclease-1-like 5' DNA nuclease
MAASDLPAARSLGGLDALSTYRVERAATRLRLRESLRASRTALRASRAAAPEEERRDPVVAMAAAEEPSIFAELLGRPAEDPPPEGVAEMVAVMPAAPDAPPEACEVASVAPPDAAAMLPPVLQAPVAPAPGVPAPVVPARSIGSGDDLGAIAELGPGMRLRLAQLGVHTLDDLARADPAALRLGLGEVSRMLRVERWIEAARSLRSG